MKLICEKCGIEYEKPDSFKKWNEEHPNVFFKWSLMYCDTHRKERELQGLKQLPNVIDNLTKL
jgi:hypothetical protein